MACSTERVGTTVLGASRLRRRRRGSGSGRGYLSQVQRNWIGLLFARRWTRSTTLAAPSPANCLAIYVQGAMDWPPLGSGLPPVKCKSSCGELCPERFLGLLKFACNTCNSLINTVPSGKNPCLTTTTGHQVNWGRRPLAAAARLISGLPESVQLQQTGGWRPKMPGRRRRRRRRRLLTGRPPASPQRSPAAASPHGAGA